MFFWPLSHEFETFRPSSGAALIKTEEVDFPGFSTFRKLVQVPQPHSLLPQLTFRKSVLEVIFHWIHWLAESTT